MDELADDRVIDLTYLKEISMGDKDMIVEMINVFLEEYDDALDDMDQLHDRENWEKLRARAHKFKPNLAYMGISVGTKRIEELEQHAKKNNAELAIESKLTALKSICDRASQELRQELQNMNAL
jgi:HPt (histidine-containing phosphotransfer) domain-containing protein